MHTRSVRTLRGASAAAIATWTAAVSHTLGGGSAPPLLLILVVTALALPVTVLLAGRSLSLVRLALAVGAAQILFHVAFASTAHLGGGYTAHIHGRYLPVGGGRAASLLPDLDMLAAHVVAAALTIVAIAYGERLLRALGRGIARLIVLPGDVALPVPHRTGRALGARPVAARRLSLTSDFSRRGPPSPFVAA